MAKILQGLAIVLLLLASLAAATCPTLTNKCPAFAQDNATQTMLSTAYLASYTFEKFTDGRAPSAADAAACIDVSGTGPWTASCQWSLSCARVNGSLAFHEVRVEVEEGTSITISNFSVWNTALLATPLMTVGGLNVPVVIGGSRTYSYATDTFVTGVSAQPADILLTLRSPTTGFDAAYRVRVFINFTCTKTIRYVYVSADSLEDDKDFWVLGVAYILPVVLIAIIVVVLLIRYLQCCKGKGGDPTRPPRWYDSRAGAAAAAAAAGAAAVRTASGQAYEKREGEDDEETDEDSQVEMRNMDEDDGICEVDGDGNDAKSLHFSEDAQSRGSRGPEGSDVFNDLREEGEYSYHNSAAVTGTSTTEVIEVLHERTSQDQERSSQAEVDGVSSHDEVEVQPIEDIQPLEDHMSSACESEFSHRDADVEEDGNGPEEEAHDDAASGHVEDDLQAEDAEEEEE